MDSRWAGSLCSDVLRGFNLNIRISSSSPHHPSIDWIKAPALYLNTDVCNSFIKDVSRALLRARSKTSMSINGVLLCSKLTDCSSPLGLCLGVPGHRENTVGGVGFSARKSHTDLIHTCPEMGVEECGRSGYVIITASRLD